MAEVAVHENASAAERAQTMQAWAVGALDMAVDEEQAHAVLLRSIHGDQEHFQHSALDLAVGIKAKTFLAQRHCLSLTAKMWLQSTADGPVIVLPDDLPYWRLVLYTVLPPINPFLWPQPTREDHDMASFGTEEALHDVHTRGASMAYAISSEERKHVHPGDKSSLVRQVSRIEIQASQQLQLNHVRKDDTMEGVTLSTMMRVFYSIPAGPLYCSSTLLLTPPCTLNPTCIFVVTVKFAWRFLFQLVLFGLYTCLVFTAVPPAEYEDVYDGSNLTIPDIEKIPFLHNPDPLNIIWIVVALSMMADGRHRAMFRSMTLSSGWARRGFKLISELLLIAAVVLRVAMEAPFQDDDKDGAGQLYQRCHVI